MVITSVNNPLIKDTVKLHKKKYRDDRKVFIIEGYHLFEEAKKYNIIRQVFTVDETITGTNVIHVSETVFNKLSQMKTPQKVLCVCNKLNNKELSDKVLILEKLQDPGNLGTLLRSALAFGFDTVILDNTVDLYNDKVIRSTQGAMFKLNILQMSTIDFIRQHKEYYVYGTSLHGGLVTETIPPLKFALILGNEGAGVSIEVLEKANQNITIRTKDVDSLNVGVAGSILMYEMSKQK